MKKTYQKPRISLHSVAVEQYLLQTSPLQYESTTPSGEGRGSDDTQVPQQPGGSEPINPGSGLFD